MLLPDPSCAGLGTGLAVGATVRVRARVWSCACVVACTSAAVRVPAVACACVLTCVRLCVVAARAGRGRMMLVSALASDDERRRASEAQPLRCWRARRHISEYLDGELDEATRLAVEAHLEGCPTCPPLYASLVGVRARLGGRRDPDSVVEADMAERIRAQFTVHR